MNKYNFGDYNSKEKLRTLLQNFEDFKRDETNSAKALHLSLDAWHLTDFVFEEFKTELKLSNIGDFRKDLIKQCEDFKIIHDLANGSKHANLTRPLAQIKLTKKHTGSFSRAFSRDFDVSHLQIIRQDDSKLDFLVVIKKVTNFWKKFFAEELEIIL